MRAIDYLNFLSAVAGRKRPIYAHFGLTHRCNLRCRMCDIASLAGSAHEATTEQIRTIADTLRSLGVIAVSLGGGEPLLRDDLGEIIGIFIKKGIQVRLLTNGILLKEDILKDLVSRGLKDVSISLDTLSADKQSYICAQDGAWDTIINSMNLIARTVPRRGRLLLVNTTVSRLNLDELPSLARFSGKLGYYISFVPIEPANARHCGLQSEDYSGEFKITPEDHQTVDRSYGELIKMKKGRNNIFNSTRFLEDSREFLKNTRKNWQCDAGRLYVSVDPQGDFSICHHFPPEGQLDHNTRGFLRSEAFKARRLKLINGCPGCMRPCWAEITHVIHDRNSLREMLKLKFSNYA